MNYQDKLVLDWNLDDASQDGYLHTRSFPLSLGDNKEFFDIKEKKIPLVILVGKEEEYVVVALSRDKYPGEINSIKETSKNNYILNEVIVNNSILKNKKIIGFSYLYRINLEIIKRHGAGEILVRKGVRIQLFKTKDKYIYKLFFIDDGLKRWRKYRQGDYISRENVETIEKIKINSSLKLSFKELGERINKKKQIKEKTKVYSEEFIRNADVIAFALKRSAGFCELCGKVSPFRKDNDEAYLEVHHLIPLSKGGDDLPVNVSALCPNCHRFLHHGKNRITEIKRLISDIKSKTEKIFPLEINQLV